MMDQPQLKANPTLHDLQQYVAAVAKQRGFHNDTITQRFMLLTEEVGELAKSARGLGGLKLATDSAKQNVGHEAADVLWMLLSICEILGVDLEQAFRDKDEYNKTRTWE